jgi:hypothetical protein
MQLLVLGEAARRLPETRPRVRTGCSMGADHRNP